METKIEINNIYKWIQQCDNPYVLRSISQMALNKAMQIEYSFIYSDDDKPKNKE